MPDGKALGPDDFPAEMLNLGVDCDPAILHKLQSIIFIVWRGGGGGGIQQWKDATITTHPQEK